jgi:hypothetical protein
MRKCLTLVNSTEYGAKSERECPELEAFSGSGHSLLFLFSVAALLLQIGHREEPLY